MEKRRVVVTGMGGLSPIGNTAEEMWENARAGVCGIDRIRSYDPSGHRVQVAGELKHFDPTDYMDRMTARRNARFTQLAMVGADEAVKQSGLRMEKEDPSRCGVNVSSGIGGLPTIEEEHYRGMEKGFDRVSPLFVPMSIANMAAGTIAIRYGLRGSCTCVVTACASGTNAIGEAFRQIRDGYQDVMITGGTESCISELGVGGFTAMRALSVNPDPKTASRPFDRNRDGFVIGEGAGILVLEEYGHALRRGAPILAEVAGYGVSCDAHHITAPMEDGSGAAYCMTSALADAGISPSEVGYINAHGTSTPMNDRCETAAVKRAFGPAADSLLMSSTKSMTGHLLGASGGVEAILTVNALRDQFAPPTAGYQTPDPDCDLDVVPNTGKPFRSACAMSNSLGFGGHNASVIFRRAESWN